MYTNRGCIQVWRIKVGIFSDGYDKFALVDGIRGKLKPGRYKKERTPSQVPSRSD